MHSVPFGSIRLIFSIHVANLRAIGGRIVLSQINHLAALSHKKCFNQSKTEIKKYCLSYKAQNDRSYWDWVMTINHCFRITKPATERWPTQGVIIITTLLLIISVNNATATLSPLIN